MKSMTPRRGGSLGKRQKNSVAPTNFIATLEWPWPGGLLGLPGYRILHTYIYKGYWMAGNYWQKINKMQGKFAGKSNSERAKDFSSQAVKRSSSPSKKKKNK